MILYDATTISRAPWPDTEQGRWAKAYLTLLVREGTRPFFSDDTTVRVVGIDDALVPITIGECGEKNSHLTSIMGRYVRHPRTALSRQAGLRPAVMSGGIAALGALLRATQIDKCIYINNWLLFRGADPSLSLAQLRRLTEFLVSRFPDHAMLFPTLNPITNYVMADGLSRSGYSLLYAGHTRMLFPYGAPMSRQERENRRRDAKLLQTSGYEIVDAAQVPGCAPRLEELYHALNGRKYTTNVTVYAEFVERAISTGLMTIRVLQKNGRIDGFYGYVVHDGVMFSPLFGYDTSLSQEVGLYRMLVYRLVQDALDRWLISETGAGADKFKSVRGDIPVPRYGAFYVDHLPTFRRMGWEVLRAYSTGPYRTVSWDAVKRVDGSKARGFDVFPPIFTPPPVELTQWGPGPRDALDSLRRAIDDAAQLDGARLEQSVKALSDRMKQWVHRSRALEELESRLEKLEQRVERQRRAHNEKNTEEGLTQAVSALLESADRRGLTMLVLGDIGKATPQEVRLAAAEVLRRAPSAVIFLAATHGNKAILLTALTQDIIRRGLSAEAFMAAVTPTVAGQGGGKPEMAFGGGSRPEAIPEALIVARGYVEERLSTG